MARLAINGGTPVRSAPFPNWPVWGQEELNGLAEVVKSGRWGSIAGERVRQFEERFAAYQGAKHGVCVNSGTTALQIGLQAVGLAPGDEVLVPAYTFIASATAVLLAQGVPVFVDIDPETCNIDLDQIEPNLTPRTRAVLPVHFGGRPVDMEGLLAITRKHGLKVVEDAAQAWGASWNGRGTGSWGDAAGFSFQSSKNINAGEGGILTTCDDAVIKMARTYANCGRSEDGQWYEHFYVGGNSRMTEFQGALLLAQLARHEGHKTRRTQNAARLNQGLAQLDGIRPLKEDSRITAHANHLYILRYDKSRFCDVPKARFLSALKAEGIPASPGYSLPLYAQPVFRERRFGPNGASVDFPVDYASVHLPHTERACQEEMVWLTQSTLLGSREDMDDIVRAVAKIAENRDELRRP